MSIVDIVIRVSLSFLFGIIIGFEREYHNRPAGVRTHIIVCLAATIIALIQQEIYLQAREFLIQNQDIAGLTAGDPTRLIAQVVSGIGFLGAGTIIVTKRFITGLTTASSLWAIAAIGIALGSGLYEISVVGFIFLFVTLTLTKRFIKFPTLKRLEIKYRHRKTTQEFIDAYFEEHLVQIRDYNFSVEFGEDYRIYTGVYTFDASSSIDLNKIVQDLIDHENLISIQILNA